MTDTRPTHAHVRSTLLGAVGLLLAAALGRPDVAVLVVPLVVHAAWGWARRPAPRELAARVHPPRTVLTEGDAADLAVHVTQAPAGSWVGVQWPGMPGAAWDPAGAAVVVVAAPTAAVATVGVEPWRWGRYSTGSPTIQVTDASGSWRAELKAPEATLLVRPEATALAGDSGVARPIGLSGAHTARVLGDGTQISDVREYRPGDRLRRINWRVTSRTQRLHVTTTVTERDTDVFVVVDTLRDLPDPAGASSSLDATVRAVAAIAQHYLGLGDRVAVHDLGARLGVVRPGAGPRQMALVLDALARTARDGSDLLRVSRVPRLRSGTLVFFLSPLLDVDVADELVRLRQLGGEVIAVDTMPVALGDPRRWGRAAREYTEEAWVIRRLQRDTVVGRIEGLGIPVTPWRGPASLASVLLAMRAARAPRRAAGQ